MSTATRIWKSLYGFGRSNYDWHMLADTVFLKLEFFRIED